VSKRSSEGCVERTHEASRRAPGGTPGRTGAPSTSPTTSISAEASAALRFATAARAAASTIDHDGVQCVTERGPRPRRRHPIRSRCGRRAGPSSRRARACRCPATAASSASCKVSARARQRDASAVASRHCASACCTASSAARKARDSSVRSGVIASSASTSARKRGGGPLDLDRLGTCGFDRGPARVDVAELRAQLPEITRDHFCLRGRSDRRGAWRRRARSRLADGR